MGYIKLCLLLLLSNYAFAQQGNENVDELTSTCILATRFRTLKKYLYQYTTESRNGVIGSANLQNVPKVTCQVEIEVPQACSFLLHTRDCALSEMSEANPQGQPMFKQAPGTEVFQAAMEKNTLKFTVKKANEVYLFPELDESPNILNIKRGIISALMVPVMDQDNISYMSTVHGLCKTDFKVKASKGIATDVSLSRDMSNCDHFFGRNLPNNPLALLQRLHKPLSKLITSTQNCNYQFDNKRKHMTSAECTERHAYMPFSSENNGLSLLITQRLILQDSAKISKINFETDPRHVKPLHLEDSPDKAPAQTKEDVLNTLHDLTGLSGMDPSQRRASMFLRLVSGLRTLGNQTLSEMVMDMMNVSGMLTWQVLVQCGTPECTSAILQAVREMDGFEVDALVFALGLQANPDLHRIRDMLSLAEYKQSKAIMYALANMVKKFYQGQVTQEVTDVSKFMETFLEDCSEDEDATFLALRTIGVMGKAMQDASSSLITTLFRCAKQQGAPAPVQKAAIQAFRLMNIDEEIRHSLLEVFRDAESSVPKRIAAYLMLFKSPNQPLVTEIINILGTLKEQQVKAFVTSHLYNIHTSQDDLMQPTRVYIEEALKDKVSSSNFDFFTVSHNYKMNTPIGSMQGNIIFEPTSSLPKEVMLESTLDAFGYKSDVLEFGIEGNGFEPSLESLFGENGFFPDSISKAMYWAGDQFPDSLQHILERIFPRQNAKMKRQAPNNLLKDIGDSFQNLIDDLKSQVAPEAIAYLRILGNEIGYIKSSEKEKMIQSLFKFHDILLKNLPTQVINKLISSTDNELLAHYIFMESGFSLPTASGFFLKFSLSGVFAARAKGGFQFSPGMQLSFMPSVGVEVITHMGIQIPDFVAAGIEMHAAMYHESSLKAKVSVNRNQIKLFIPAPKGDTKLLSFSNKLVSVSSGQTNIEPSPVGDEADTTECRPLVMGLKLCTTMPRSDPSSREPVPHNPWYAIELRPTGEVSGYSATIASETRREGEEVRQKVKTLKLTLKAEGTQPAEATATLMYNRNDNTVTADILIPDCDVEARIHMVATNSFKKGSKMHDITIDVSNKNISKLSLIGQTRLETMSDAMLHIQMIIPSLKADASVTATLKNTGNLVMQLETSGKIHEIASLQKVILNYDDKKFQIEIMSDINSEIKKIIPIVAHFQRKLQVLIDEMMDQKVAKTDMKLRHIVLKAIEAGNIWLDKVAAGNPYVENLRNKSSFADLHMPTLPEKLFLQFDSVFRYQFNKNKKVFSFVLPSLGKFLEKLNIPTSQTVLPLSVPEIGLDIPANNYSVPSFTIPRTLNFMVPLLGLAEVTTKVNSNLYKWEGSFSGGNTTVDVPRYSAQCKVTAHSPINLLSYKLEGTGMIQGTIEENLKYLMNGSFSHSLIDASFSVVETFGMSDKLNAWANYKMEAIGPLGLHTLLYYSAKSTLNSEEVTGDSALDGMIKVGSFYSNTTYTHNYAVRPLAREGKGESSFQLNSPLLHINSVIKGMYTKGELLIASKTNVQNDALKHVAELKYKDAQLSLKCEAVSSALGTSMHNGVELGLSSQMGIVRIESEAEDATNRAYSLVTGSMNSDGLELNAESSLTFIDGRGSHRTSILVGGNGLVASSSTSLRCSPITFENIFNGVVDSRGASLSLVSKGMAKEIRGELTIEGKVSDTEASLNSLLKGYIHDASGINTMNLALNRKALTFSNNMKGSWQSMKTENINKITLSLWSMAFLSKTYTYVCEDISYKHDVRVNMKPFVYSLGANYDLKHFDLNLNNKGYVKAEPFQIDLTGSVGGSFGEEQNITQIYEISYSGLAGTLKYRAIARVMETQLNHNCELEFAGLAAKLNCEAQLNSESLHFDSSFRTMLVPFSFTTDAVVNSDGEINLHGKHKMQLHSKLLLKAELVAFTFSHECKTATTHLIRDRGYFTEFDNILNGLLTPSDQSLSWKTKAKLNDHSYNQDFVTYNNVQKIGIEVASLVSTDLLSKFSPDRTEIENQKYRISGILRYDKNSDSHVIKLPLIKSIPVAFECAKSFLVYVLESQQKYIADLDLPKIIYDFRNYLDNLPKQVSDLMSEIDLEDKVDKLKETLAVVTKDYAVTLDDLEAAVEKARVDVEQTLLDIATKVRDLIAAFQLYVERGDLSLVISNVLLQVENVLKQFDEYYEIRHTLIKVVDAIKDIIRQIDLQKLTGSSFAWLKDLHAKFDILDKIEDEMGEIRQIIETFDVSMVFKDLKDYILTVNLTKLVNQLSTQIPSFEITIVIDSMKDIIVNWIEEYETADKINAVYFYVRDLLLKYDIDKKVEVFLDQSLILIKEFRIEETVQTLVDGLRAMNFEFVHETVVNLLQSVTGQLKAIDFRQFIDLLNESISSAIKLLKEFDYNEFVEKANEKILELTNSVNKHFQSFQIPQKIEAFREYLREIQASMIKYIEQLKKTNIAEIVKMLTDLIDKTAYNDIRLKAQEILEDMKQRLIIMDIRNELYIYLQRASESYTNMVSYISIQLDHLKLKLQGIANDQEITKHINEAVNGFLDALKFGEIEFPSFMFPFTDIVIPAFTINLNNMQEISIPAEIFIPEFTILGFYTVPAFSIDFEEIKSKIISLIDSIRNWQIQMPDPKEIFGDLKALYLINLPDFTFPEITVLEFRFPEINIPKLNLENFEITMLPIPEIKMPQLPSDVNVYVFGQLYGEVRVNSPQYTLLTTAIIENATSSSKTPKFSATLASQAQSNIDFLEHSLEATAHLEAPEMQRLMFTQSVKARHMALSIDHEGSLNLTGESAVAATKTSATTQMFIADWVNNIALSIENGISASMNTTYNHYLNIPNADVSSQATVTQNVVASFESGTISVSVGAVGNGKWSYQENSDEGTHRSDLELNVDVSKARLGFAMENTCKALKLKQTLLIESIILSHITVEAKAETELPFVKNSLFVFKGEADLGKLKFELSASHDAELIGRMSGTISNSLEFMACPFEIVLDSKNKGNPKISFPLQLSGKIDFQHDYGVILNSETQRASWVGLFRFNQYRCNHNFTMENSPADVSIHTSASGEANLEFLTVPLTIPEMTVPYFEIKTPSIRELSLWEDGYLKYMLTTTQQSFEMDLKLQYEKNSDVHIIPCDFGPIHALINEHSITLQAHLKNSRDNIVTFLINSYDNAKKHYDKHKIDTSSQPPRILKVPGNKMPILNIEVPAFWAELLALSFVFPQEVSAPSFEIPTTGCTIPSHTLVLPSLEWPVFYVPETLSALTLPTLTLPSIGDKIMIPAMGNITYNFSFKSPMIFINSKAGLYNQSGIVGEFASSSTSSFDILNGKIDFTTSFTPKKSGLILATAVSLEHKHVEGSHDCRVSLSSRSVEASMGNVIKLNLPFLNLQLNQELLGDTNTQPNVASNIKLKYKYNLPQIETLGMGSIHHNLALKVLSSYVLLETVTKGNTNIAIMESCYVTGVMEKETQLYLSANGLRSTMKNNFNSNIIKNTLSLLNADMDNELALEVSLHRVYVVLNSTSHNNANISSFDTNGNYIVKATLDFVPFKTLKTFVEIDASQPCSLGYAGVFKKVNLVVTPKDLNFFWSGKEQFGSYVHACDLHLFSDDVEVRIEWTGSVEGQLAFLKSIRLPVYHQTIWDLLKFDQATSIDGLQFLNISSSIVYKKSMDGLMFVLPFKVFENGVTFSLPSVTFTTPGWVKEIPSFVRNFDMRFEDIVIADHISIPLNVNVPSFDVPFTTLQVPTFAIDPNNFHIPKVVITTGFEIVLPGLPRIRIPSFNIDTDYLQDKINSLSLKVEQYDITISKATLNLNDIASHILHFKLPIITIPEQRIKIPAITVHLPASVFIPSFAALSTVTTVSSPIYNLTVTTNLENKDSSMVTSLKSICTSTMAFLEHDLDVGVALSLDNGTVSLNGRCNFVHADANVDLQHFFAQNTRLRRQAHHHAIVRRHALNLDVTSPTFVDVSFRYATRKDGFTASMSSPSSGFLGLQLQRRSPSQLYGKIFSRYLATPEKDSDIISFKATLRNSGRLSLQTSWSMDVLHDLIEGFKERIPAITGALLKFINKYHTAQFGYGINRASIKLKDYIYNVIEKAHHEVPMSLDALRNSMEQLIDQSKARLGTVTDTMTHVNMQEFISYVKRQSSEFLQRCEESSNAFMGAAIMFLKETTFTVPVFEEKLTGLEIYQKANQFVTMGIVSAVQSFSSLIKVINETIVSFIRRIEFTFPSSSAIETGREMVEKVKIAFSAVEDDLLQSVQGWNDVSLEVLLEQINEFLKRSFQNARYKVSSLSAENLSIEIDRIYADIFETLLSAQQLIVDASKIAAEYKDHAKLKLQEVHNSMTVENLNRACEDLISVLQSYLYSGINQGIDTMKLMTQITAPYMRITNKRFDIEIPLPFVWKSFTEWPTPFM